MNRPAVLFLAVSLAALAQDPPTFEVATVKLSPPPQTDSININLGTFRDGRLTMNNVTLRDIVKFAYELVSDDQFVGPDWNREVRFDVEALASPATAPGQLHRMTQTLLAERLGLKVRRETRVLPHLALIVDGKHRMPAARTAEQQPAQYRGKLQHTQMTMQLLASLLSRFERQTIIDKTGLAGTWQVSLSWTPDINVAATNRPPGPSLFTAVREQLGLRLESRRGPMEVLIVEQAWREPAPN